MVGLVLLGSYGGLPSKPSASPQHARLQERTWEQAAYDLLDALLLSPVTVELPPGFTALPPREGTTTFIPSGQYAPTEAVGGVGVAVRGPDPQAGFYFDASATAAEAEAS